MERSRIFIARAAKLAALAAAIIARRTYNMRPM